MMNKLLLGLLVSFNVNAADNGVSKILDAYARQPQVVYVQPNNQIYPVPQSIPVVRGDRLEQADFMLPEVRETKRIDLLGDKDE